MLVAARRACVLRPATAAAAPRTRATRMTARALATAAAGSGSGNSASAKANAKKPKAGAAKADAAAAAAAGAGAAPPPFFDARAKDLEEAQRARPEWTPYPSLRDDLKPTHTIADVVRANSALAAGEQRSAGDADAVVQVSGRVLSKREASKNLIFYDLHAMEHGATAGAAGSRIQVVASQKAAAAGSDFALHRVLRRGDIVTVRGVPGRTKAGELSVFVSHTALLAPCLHDIPLKLVDSELRYRQRYLDWLVRTAAPHAPPPPAATAAAAPAPAPAPAAAAASPMAAFIQRSRVISGIRAFLDSHGFVEVETPILWPKHGGAAARPFVTHSRVLGADLPLHMRVAPELFLKQLVIGGLPRVYELGKVFRNESLDATHNPEFTSVEFYQAFASYHDLMPFTEQLLRAVVQRACGTLRVPLKLPDGSGSSAVIDFAQPFQRLDIMQTLRQQLKVDALPDPNDPASRDALLALCRAHGVAVQPPHTNARILDKLIGAFVEPLCVTTPTFLLHHPECMSPLAKGFGPSDSDGAGADGTANGTANGTAKRGLTQRFELFVGGAELCNAYSELNDPHEQRRRLTAQAADAAAGDDEAQLPDEDFCVALEHGLPPTAGWGLGVDRLCMLLAQTPHIRDVLLFPIMKPNAAPATAADAAAAVPPNAAANSTAAV